MNCPRCGWQKSVPNGKTATKKQRYRCKDCQYIYSVELKYGAIEARHKRVALIMYLHGMKMIEISSHVGVTYEAVQYWIDRYLPKHHRKIRLRKPIKIIDERDVSVHIDGIDALAHLKFLIIETALETIIIYPKPKPKYRSRKK